MNWKKILKALRKKEEIIGIYEGVILIRKIINFKAIETLSNDLTALQIIDENLRARIIPTVVLVGSHTGQIYYFALNRL